MRRHWTLIALASISTIAVSGCNEHDTTGDTTPKTATASSNMPAHWNATDACSILDKSHVAEALHQDVQEAQLGLVHQPGPVDAATSECHYISADGTSLATLMTRWSPINDNSAESIAGTRNAAASAMKAFSDKPIEDIPGMGKAAFFIPGIDALNVFLDDARMIVLTVQKVPDGAKGKDIAISLATKAGT